MINDFNEIENEKDRELYIKMRSLLDKFFMNTIEFHKSADHNYHECFNDDLNECRRGFIAARKSISKVIDEEEMISRMSDSIIEQLTDSLKYLIILEEFVNGLDKIENYHLHSKVH
jgi:hypothetical protein